jgi:Uma2 family endonuclease
VNAYPPQRAPETLRDGEFVVEHGGGIDPARRWSLADLSRMLKAGIVTVGDREILRGGEVLLPESREPPHIAAMDILWECLRDRLDRGDCWLRSQRPMALGEGFLPEPEVAVVRGPRQDYDGRFPGGSDAALVAEVVVASFPKDASELLRGYAAAGVAATWIVDLDALRVGVYHNPYLVGGVGVYDDPVFYGLADSVPLVLAGAPGLPDREYPPIAVREILRASVEPLG